MNYPNQSENWIFKFRLIKLIQPNISICLTLNNYTSINLYYNFILESIMWESFVNRFQNQIQLMHEKLVEINWCFFQLCFFPPAFVSAEKKTLEIESIHIADCDSQHFTKWYKGDGWKSKTQKKTQPHTIKKVTDDWLAQGIGWQFKMLYMQINTHTHIHLSIYQLLLLLNILYLLFFGLCICVSHC